MLRLKLELVAPVRKNALFTDDLPLNAPPVRKSASFTDDILIHEACNSYPRSGSTLFSCFLI